LYIYKSLKNPLTMLYIYIPLIIVAVFVIYSLYVLLIEKNPKKIKPLIFPVITFIIIWVIFYYFILKA